MSPVATVLNALYLAGGPTAHGSFRDVRIIRGGSTAHSIDLYEYLLRGNNLDEIRLDPGDVIFVPCTATMCRCGARWSVKRSTK